MATMRRNSTSLGKLRRLRIEALALGFELLEVARNADARLVAALGADNSFPRVPLAELLGPHRGRVGEERELLEFVATVKRALRRVRRGEMVQAARIAKKVLNDAFEELKSVAETQRETEIRRWAEQVVFLVHGSMRAIPVQSWMQALQRWPGERRRGGRRPQHEPSQVLFELVTDGGFDGVTTAKNLADELRGKAKRQSAEIIALTPRRSEKA
jgi:hypothetical protein